MRINLAFLLIFVSISLACSDESINVRSPAGLFEPANDKNNANANGNIEPSPSDKKGLTNNGSPLQAIKLKEGLAELPAGTRTGWVALGVYKDKSTRILSNLVTWTVSDQKKATLANNPPGTLLTKASGEVELKATLGKVAGSTTITVSDAYIISLTLLAEKSEIPVGGNGTILRAEGRFSDNRRYDVSPVVTFSSSRERIAEVSNQEDNKGFVRGKRSGLVTMTALHSSGETAELSMRILDPLPWSLHIMGDQNEDPMPACLSKDEPGARPRGKYKDIDMYIRGDTFVGFGLVYFSDCRYESSTNIQWEIVEGPDDLGDFGDGSLDANELRLNRRGKITVRARYNGLVSNSYEINVKQRELIGLILAGQSGEPDSSLFDHCRSAPNLADADDPKMKVDDPVTGTKDLRLHLIQNNCEITAHDGSPEVTWQSSDATQADFKSSDRPNRVTAITEGRPEVWAELSSDAMIQSGKFKLDIAAADSPEDPPPDD